VIGIGMVALNLALYLLQVFYNRKRNVQVEKILTKTYKRADLVEYLTSLDEFKSALISVNEPEEVASKTCEYIRHTLATDISYIYLWNEDSGAFHPKPQPEDESLNTLFYVYDPFVLWLSDNPRVVLESDLETLSSVFGSINVKGKEFFTKTKAKIIVPLVLNRGLLGILTIGAKINNQPYQLEDFDKLTEIVEVSALSLSNSIFYQQLISMTENLEAKVKERTRELEETQSQLIMSEKMASLGVMVAGIAHEINTPAGVINAASDNIQENMLYTFKHINSLYTYLNDPKIRLSFRKINVRLLRDKPIIKIDPTNKFKFKREIKERFKQAGLSEKDAGDGALFLVDNSVPEIFPELLILYQNNAHSLVELLQNGISADRNIRNIKYSIKNIVRIVKALKYYSHLDQSSYGEADLTDAIENTLVILHNQIKQGIEIERNYTEIPKVRCNIDELNQVWTNLINNAMHALKGIKNPKIRIHSSQKILAGNPYVQITIEDNGIGIQKENLDRIWDPFFTTKDQGEGSGLGLGIVKGIIEKHKGTIKVESRPGLTKFMVFLPIHQDIDSPIV
jgi:signal transduction histidine kinase